MCTHLKVLLCIKNQRSIVGRCNNRNCSSDIGVVAVLTLLQLESHAIPTRHKKLCEGQIYIVCSEK